METNDNLGFRRFVNQRGLLGTAANYPETGRQRRLPDQVEQGLGWFDQQGQLFFTGAQPRKAHDPPQTNTITQYIHHHYPTLEWAVCNIQRTAHQDRIIADILAARAIAVSDGSFQHGRGTAAFTIRPGTAPQAQFITAVSMVTGHHTDQSAYRSELAGLAGILITLKAFSAINRITQGHVTIF